MNKLEKFKIIPYKNPSGEIVSRVIGKLKGKLIRENFRELPVAMARKQELEIQALNMTLPLTMQPTRLSIDQLRDAEAALHRLDGTPHNLGFAVDYLLRNYRDDQVQKTVDEALEQYIKEKRAHNLRPRSVSDITTRMGILKKRWASRKVSEVTTQDVKEALYQGTRCPQTILNYRRTAYTFFEWCVRQNYATENVVRKIDAPSVQRGEPKILALADIRALLLAAQAHKEGVLVPFLALSLFTGLRAAELRRITWADVDLEEKILQVTAEVAKLRSRRLIELADNVVAWLKPYQDNPLVSPNWRKDFDQVRRAAGFVGSFPKKGDEALKAWPVNVLRHTAISFWQAHFKAEGECADRHGNSVEMVHKHYRGLVKQQDAKTFWTFTPDNIATAGLIVPFPAVAA